MSRRLLNFTVFAVTSLWISVQSCVAAPSVADALKLKPVQPNIDFDTPAAADLASCTIKNEDINGASTLVVRDGAGNTLRQFSDSNGDNIVDTWSYYQGGLEVYRDIDANFNGKADQYRWFHGAGMRWGIDRDENGKIDSWKLISAEEVAEEAVAAAKLNNPEQFERLLLTDEELKQLKLEVALNKQIAERIAAAPAKFRQLVASQELKRNLEFRDFGGIRPGMIPVGARGTDKDLLVYENVWAMVKLGEDFEQLQLGTLVNFKGAWKLLDCPSVGSSSELAGIFYGSGSPNVPSASANLAMNNDTTDKMQEILSELESLDQKLVQASGKQKESLNRERADLLLRLANSAANDEERSQWIRQLADMVSASTQDGSFPSGPEYLKQLEEKLTAQGLSDNVISYIEFQRMLAVYYGLTLVDPDVDHAKAHEQWLKDLEAFVEAHPNSENCAEALRQLAMGSEISGDDKQAVAWYEQIVSDHPNSIHSPIAKGAIVRLSSVGKPVQLQGKAINGASVDLSKLTGKSVVIQYWTTTSDVSKADHAVLSDLYKKYGGGRGLEIIGVNLDYSRDDLDAYLASNRLSWPQLYAEGGFESQFAQEMGVITVPLMLLVGPDGAVINNNIQAAEIEEAIKSSQTRQASRQK